MRPYFGMPFDASDCARDMVQLLGCSEPPISEVSLLQHLGLTREFFCGSEFFVGGDSQDDENSSANAGQLALFDDGPYRQVGKRLGRRNRKPVDAALYGNTVWVDREFPLERQRAAICHEAGHKVLPWHEALSYMRDGCLIDFARGTLWGRHKGYEEEANKFSAHFLMPLQFFLEDMNSLPVGIETIEALAARYATSIESTAIHYVGHASIPCALLVAEALADGDASTEGFRLRVRYSRGSPSFKHFIAPGTGILADSPVAVASLMPPGSVHSDEVSGHVLGLRPDRKLILHCRAWGPDGHVLVLVEEPHPIPRKLF